MRRVITRGVVVFGTISGAVAKWVLVWLFARTSGGADAVGLYSAILAYATPLFVVCQLGLRTLFLSLAQRWPWRSYLVLRAVGTAVGTLVMVMVLSVVPQFGWGLGLSILALKVSESGLDIFLARIQFGNRMLMLGSVQLVTALSTMAAAATVVLRTGDIVLGVLAAAGVSTASILWAAWAAYQVKYKAGTRESGFRAIVSSGVPVTISQFLASLLFQLPIIVLSMTVDDEVVGRFAGAAFIITAGALVGGALQTLLITPFRRVLAAAGQQELVDRAIRITVQSIVVGSPLVLLVTVAGDRVLMQLYGQEFAVGGTSLFLLGVAALVTVGSFVLSVSVTVMNRYRSVTIAMGLSCVIALAAGGVALVLNLESIVVGAVMAACGSVARLFLMAVVAKRA